MSRKKRGNEWKTHLTKFLAELREQRGMTYREMARIAGSSTSTVHGWANGAMPCESIVYLKRLCENVGVPLAVALTGSREATSAPPPALSDYFEKREMFDGFAQIKVVRLIPRGSQGFPVVSKIDSSS